MFKFKKLLSLSLAIIMSFGFSTTAFATEKGNVSNDSINPFEGTYTETLILNTADTLRTLKTLCYA